VWRSHPLYTSPNTYSDLSKETVEEELGSLFLKVIERLEREERLPELLESPETSSGQVLNKNQ